MQENLTRSFLQLESITDEKETTASQLPEKTRVALRAEELKVFQSEMNRLLEGFLKQSLVQHANIVGEQAVADSHTVKCRF